MPRSAHTGTRIRERRAFVGLKQAELARVAGISASYLNLIEHNRRRIGGKLLTEIAQALGTDIASLTQGTEAERLDRLIQAAAEAPDVDAEVARTDDFTGRFPGWAALVEDQARRLQLLRERIEGLTDRLTYDPRLSSAMHDVLSKTAAIRSAAAILVETEDIDEAWRGRFQRNLHGDSVALAERAQDLVAYLDASDDEAVSPGGAMPWQEVEAFLAGRDFFLPTLETASAAPEAMAACAQAVEALLDGAPSLSLRGRALARQVLQRAARDACALPLAEAQRCLRDGLDPAAVAAETDLPASLVLRRMAAVPPPQGRERAGLVLADGTGRLLMHKPTPGFPVPRAGQACALWPLYEALGQPGQPVTRSLAHAAAQGAVVCAHAVAERAYPFGAAGPPLTHVWMLLVPQDAAAEPALPVGSACRVCPREGCLARAEPSVLATGFDSGG